MLFRVFYGSVFLLAVRFKMEVVSLQLQKLDIYDII